ncbi:hypothetical protein TNCV_3509451 [Trichonephila clavipes]|nr:hypothetical protein TNCV_3509451 [Trichonephila clavipes]
MLLYVNTQCQWGCAACCLRHRRVMEHSCILRGVELGVLCASLRKDLKIMLSGELGNFVSLGVLVLRLSLKCSSRQKHQLVYLWGICLSVFLLDVVRTEALCATLKWPRIIEGRFDFPGTLVIVPFQSTDPSSVLAVPVFLHPSILEDRTAVLASCVQKPGSGRRIFVRVICAVQRPRRKSRLPILAAPRTYSGYCSNDGMEEVGVSSREEKEGCGRKMG